MKKLFTLAAAVLASLSLWAADYTPTTVYTVGDASTLGSTWASKNQKQDTKVLGDTTVMSSYLIYQSAGDSPKQSWAGTIGSGSTGTSWSAQFPFLGSANWYTSSATAATVRSTRQYIYNVTNCTAVLTLVKSGSSSTITLAAYEITLGEVSSTAAASSTTTSSSETILKIEGLDASKTYRIKIFTDKDSNSTFYEIAFVSAPSCPAGKPGDISKGDLVTGTLTLNVAGTPETGDTWYWQLTEDGEDILDSNSSFDVTTAGTYYIRSYNADADCWSDAKSIVIVAADLVENYTVKYLDGTEVLGQEVVAVGSAPEGIQNPTKECYTFDGWQQNGVDIAIPDVTGTSNEIVELTAKWAPIYAISFNFGDSTMLTKDNIKAKLNSAGYSCSVGTGGSYDNGGTTGYLGYKFKNKNDYVAFIVAAGREAIVTYGYTESGWKVNGEDAGVAVATKAYVNKKYKAVGSDLLLKIVNQSADSKTSVLTNIVIRDTPATSPNDATLSELTVDGFVLTPDFDPATETYSITKAYGADDPAKSKITAVPNNEDVHSLTIDSLGGQYTITVVSEDESVTKVYTINVIEAAAPKSLAQVKFANGFDAFIDNTNHTVKAFYLAGDAAPEVDAIVAGAGTAGPLSEGKIVVTGADYSSIEYTVTLEAVTPNTNVVTEAASAGAFDGTETWVKNGLKVYGNSAGFSDGKYVLRRQIKGSDAADDQRVIAGWVRTYFFVGNASKLELSNTTNNKKVKYAIDGGEYTESEANPLVIALEEGNHMIEIVTNQQSGDCNLSAPKLVERTATGINNTEDGVKAVKVIRDGQLLIIKGDKTFNIIGAELR